jgi:effector-binding domain-containing protein
MKLFKGTLYFLLIMLAAILLASLFAPGTKVISRTIRIDAPRKVVFAQLADLKKWPKWDAWYAKDLNQVRTFSGGLGDKIQGFSWSSKQEGLGNGSLVIKSFVNNVSLDFTLVLINKGRKYNFDGKFILKERNGQTVLTWEIESEQRYPFKIINYFLEKWIGPDFSQGLENLKGYVETSSNQELGITENSVTTVEEHGIVYALLAQEQLSESGMEAFFSNSLKKIYNYLKTNNIKPKGAPVGLFYEWDEENHNVNVAAAVPTTPIIQRPDSTVVLKLGNAELYSNRISFIHKGSYETLKKTHLELQSWLKENAVAHKIPVIEEYMKGRSDGVDTSQYMTRVSYYFE